MPHVPCPQGVISTPPPFSPQLGVGATADSGSEAARAYERRPTRSAALLCPPLSYSSRTLEGRLSESGRATRASPSVMKRTARLQLEHLPPGDFALHLGDPSVAGRQAQSVGVVLVEHERGELSPKVEP